MLYIFAVRETNGQITMDFQGTLYWVVLGIVYNYASRLGFFSGTQYNHSLTVVAGIMFPNAPTSAQLKYYRHQNKVKLLVKMPW